MTARIPLALLVFGLVGCRAFEPPSSRRPGDGCHADRDCGPMAICNNGQCDTTHCHVDAQCQSQLCVGTDGGVPGSCATRECTKNADCGPALVCKRLGLTVACVPGCETNDDCPTPTVCSRDFSITGTCGGQCRTDADCGGSLFCAAFHDGGFTSCLSTRSCHSDAECPGCDTCSSQSPTTTGYCTHLPSAIDGGILVLGDLTKLSMTDNLSSSVAAVQSAMPGSALVRVTSSMVQADGTVNIASSTSASASWTYGFVTADGGGLTVNVSPYARRCALVSFSGSTETTPPIADAAIANLVTPAAFIADFITHPLCNAWQGTTSDYFYVLGRADGGASLLANMKDGDAFFGDALSGQGTYSCN